MPVGSFPINRDFFVLVLENVGWIKISTSSKEKKKKSGKKTSDFFFFFQRDALSCVVWFLNVSSD